MPKSVSEVHKGQALALLALTQFIVILDASIVNVALPTIGKDLAFSQTDLSWVFNAYTIPFGGFLLLGGRLADLLGRRRLFVLGVALFAAASLAAGLAQSDTMLVVARAFQGLGGALVSPAALALLTTTFTEGAERNKALGVWGAVAGLGGAAGTLLGGVFTEFFGWEWVFLVNVPIGIFAAVMAPRILAESKEEHHGGFDFGGAFSVTAGLSLLVYAVVNAPTAGWGSGETIGLAAGAIALLVAFVIIELRSSSPLVPFSIFKRRTIAGANITGLLIGMSIFSMFFVMSLYLQRVLEYKALTAGLAFLPLTAVLIASAGNASQLLAKIGFKVTMLIGLVLMTIGLFWLSFITVEGPYWSHFLLPSLFIGAGMGHTFVPLLTAATFGTGDGEAGLASGLINTSQQVGGALGVAILTAVAASTTASLTPPGQKFPSPAALNSGYQDAFMVATGFALFAALVTAIVLSSSDSKSHAEAARLGEAAPPAI